jgi:hypothetical protein
MKITTIILLTGVWLTTSLAQRRIAPAQIPVPAASRQKNATTSGESQWWAAQRSIETAIQQLKSYLRESPKGERAETARQQIAVLLSLTMTASQPEWVTMDHMVPLLDVPDWRVASVDRQADITKLTVEIRCKRDDGEDCRFLPFNRYPLVLVDNAGRYYPMLEASPTAPEIRLTPNGKAVLTGGRILAVTVDFAPLATEAFAGQVHYRDDNRADPARFSVLRQR